jgi:hypothetical protein
MVDLPTPGSPPTSSAEPGTSPPPQTRSNSAIPVTRRPGAMSSVFRSSSAKARPFLRGPALLPSGAGAASSVIEFHAPQASHLPAHLVVTAPQDWQTKVAEVRAIESLFWWANLEAGRTQVQTVA